MIKNIKKKKGFTLIELIIVIAIIGILAAIAIPKFGDIQKNAKVKADIATGKTISDAVSVLVSEGKIPETLGTTHITKAAADGTDSDAKDIATYLQSVPTSGVYKGNNFWVTVSDGNATISISNVATDTASTTQVYPNGADPYNK